MACFEDRVKNSLAYLSGLDSKATELVRLSPEVSPSNRRSIQRLLERIRTFSQATWFAKPDWLSPVNCARLGWQNVDVDLLECSRCKAVVSAKLPSSQNAQVYDECCKRLENLLQNGHRNCCSRKNRPTPSELCRLTLQSRSVELEDFIGRVKGLMELKSHLPIVEESAFTSLKLSLDDVIPLCRLVANVYPRSAELDQSVLMSASVLALCGWNVSTSTSCGELVECKFCSRKVGLWNCFSQSQEFDEEVTTTMSGYYGDSEVAVGNHDNCTEESFSEDACELTAVPQETDVCGENMNGGVIGVEREQNIAWTDDKNPDSCKSPGDGKEEREMMEDVPLESLSELQTINISADAVVIFSRSDQEQILGDEDATSIQVLTDSVLCTNDALKIADSFCDAEMNVVVEEEPAKQMLSEQVDHSVDRETVASNDAESGCQNAGSTECRSEDVVSGVEVSRDECAMDSTECADESVSVQLVCSVEVFSDIPDALGSGVTTCDTINSSSNSFGASAVFPAQHDSSDGGVGGGIITGGTDEDSSSRSDAIVTDEKRKQGDLTETLPSVSDEIVLASDGSSITGTIGISDEQSGCQQHSEDPLQCATAATDEDAATGLDGIFEERRNGIPDEIKESNDGATSSNSVGDQHEENSVKPVSNDSNKTDISDSPADESTNQPAEGPTNQPADEPTNQPGDEPTNQPADEPNDQPVDEPTNQPADEPNNQLTAQLANTPDQPTTQPQTDELIIQLTATVQPDQSTNQQTVEAPDQLTKEQLADQATVVELEGSNGGDVEPRGIQGSVKRTASTPEESKLSAKRRRLARPVRGCFDPVSEHRPWCIWVQDLKIRRCPRTTGGKEDVTGCSIPQHPWIRLFHLLLQPNQPDNRDVRRALSVVKSL